MYLLQILLMTTYECCTVRRNSSNLPIKGRIVANQDPPKNQLSALQARDGLLVWLAACHAGGRRFYSKSSSFIPK